MSCGSSTASRRAAALALAWLGLAALPASASAESWEALPVNPRVDFEYVRPPNARLTGIYERLKGRKVLEELQRFMSPLHLPHHLRLKTEQCDQVNAFYSSSDRSLTICYEMIEDDLKKAPETVSPDGFITRQQAVIGDLIGTVLHEGGHMLFDMLDAPVFGREEDAADQNADFIALQFSKDVARVIVKGYVWTWAKEGDPSDMTAFSDEHGTNSQRMYNMLCLAYGGDPENFKEFVEKEYLPKKRADHCAAEYAQVKRAFVKTVLPFIDQELMKRVQQADWLTTEERK
jgi:hypothetical protein